MPAYKRPLANGKVMWRFCTSYKGKKYNSPAIYEDKHDAQIAEVEWKTEQRYIKQGESLSALIKKRVKDLERSGKSPKYVKDNERYLEHLENELNDPVLTSVTKMQVRDVLNAESDRLKSNGYTNYAVNQMLRAFKSFFGWCIDYLEVEMKNPCRGISPYPVPIKHKYIPPDIDLLDLKSNYLSEEECRLLEFVEQTACRIDEAQRFKMEDIQSDGHILLYTKKSRFSNLMPRKVPRPPVLGHMKLPKSGLVFGRRWKTYPKFLGKVTEKMIDAERSFYYRGHRRQKWTWHNLRHMTASKWMEAGMPLHEIQHRLGHSSITTTEGYLQLLGFTDPGNPLAKRKRMVPSVMAFDENGDVAGLIDLEHKSREEKSPSGGKIKGLDQTA